MPITRPIDTLVLGGGMAGTFAALAAKTPDYHRCHCRAGQCLGRPRHGRGRRWFLRRQPARQRPFCPPRRDLGPAQPHRRVRPARRPPCVRLGIVRLLFAGNGRRSGRRNSLPRPRLDGATRRRAHRLGRGCLRLGPHRVPARHGRRCHRRLRPSPRGRVCDHPRGGQQTTAHEPVLCAVGHQPTRRPLLAAGLPDLGRRRGPAHDHLARLPLRQGRSQDEGRGV